MGNDLEDTETKTRWGPPVRMKEHHVCIYSISVCGGSSHFLLWVGVLLAHYTHKAVYKTQQKCIYYMHLLLHYAHAHLDLFSKSSNFILSSSYSLAKASQEDSKDVSLLCIPTVKHGGVSARCFELKWHWSRRVSLNLTSHQHTVKQNDILQQNKDHKHSFKMCQRKAKISDNN